MNVNLDKEDLIRLVKSIGPNPDVFEEFSDYGAYNGQKYEWNDTVLRLSNDTLWALYNTCKESWKKENQFKVGQTALYMDKEVDIEEIFQDGTAKIENPLWDFDEEGMAVENDEDYNEPFWITVPLKQLKKKVLV